MNTEKINKNTLLVLGAGESGIGAALLGKKQGWNVFVSDKGKIRPSHKDELLLADIPFEEETHNIAMAYKPNLIVKSPGIPDSSQLILSFKDQQIPIISEIEFASYYSKAKTICITGSNGKTTTTLLIHHILSKTGFSVGLAGNIGESYARKVANETYDWFVLELSSFQLDGMYKFHPHIAILLNITPDHLDRYQYDFQKYIASKMRIIQNMTDADYLIYNADDPVIVNALSNLKELKTRCIPFSIKQELERGGYVKEEKIIVNINKDNIKNPFIMSIHELALKGKHNTQNSLAASVAARLLEIRKQSIRESLTDFVNVEHRMEFVAKVNDIEFINDSKATNVNATWFALESMDKPTIWIAGGQDKGNDYSDLIDLVKQNVKAIVCLGKDNAKIIDTFSSIVPTIVEVESAIEAVGVAYQLAKKDEAVLLSPACASFDRFSDYIERGNAFKAAVRTL